MILGCEFDLTVLGALLAILGYSINDKIVVYDRIRENLASRTAHDFPNMVNDSLNQTLSRTILTGGTAIFASFALYFWGGPVIETFGARDGDRHHRGHLLVALHHHADPALAAAALRQAGRRDAWPRRRRKKRRQGPAAQSQRRTGRA